ncbi:MAG: hypothetical protein IPN20_03705 [Haliscomenobacter sp.]|nr:hypothetical protein [Haliscomenobacter sp.]
MPKLYALLTAVSHYPYLPGRQAAARLYERLSRIEEYLNGILCTASLSRSISAS